MSKSIQERQRELNANKSKRSERLITCKACGIEVRDTYYEYHAWMMH